MQVDIRQLREVLDRVLDHVVRDLGVVEVSVDKDCYWEVSEDYLYHVQTDPPQLDIGRLTDDWEFLQALLDDKDQAVALTLIHVAPILRYLALKIGQ